MITCTFENGKQTSFRHVVVHAIVEQDGKLLLVKRAPTLSLEAGKWSLPSGFLDRDETAAQGVLRELREETGWEGEVTALLLVKTDPNRPHEDRQNVALHFLVKPLHQGSDKDQESSEVSWVPVNELPALDTFAFDHGEAIGFFLKYRTQPFSLPILL